jgi:hypothetical protein
VGLEQCSLSLVTTIEELLIRKSSSSGRKETDITAIWISHADHATSLCPLKLALTSPTSGSHSVSIVHSQTKVIELLVI